MYAGNFNQSRKQLDKLENDSNYDEFKNYIDQVSNYTACKGNTLGSYLIMPVQRIPRYLLLIKELLRKLENQNNPSTSLLDSINLLQSALKKLEESANNVNESIRSRENGEILAKIQQEVGNSFVIFQPGRKFILREDLFLLDPEWKTSSIVRDGVVCFYCIYNLYFLDLRIFTFQ